MSAPSRAKAGRRRAFDARVYEIVRAIPPGRVMSYGMIGGLIPPPAGLDGGAYEKVRARWVGYAMSDCPDDIPWHRVINATGRVSVRAGFGAMKQRALLEQEGIQFDERGRICLEDYRWLPGAGWLESHGLTKGRT